MNSSNWYSRLLRGGIAIAVVVALAAATPRAGAVTVAYWDFEDGVAGQEFTQEGEPNGSGGSVDTANGILMRGFNPEFGAAFTADTADGLGLAMDLEVGVDGNTTSDGYVPYDAMDPAPIFNWAPAQWTIETHVLLRDTGGWNSIIGRDGSTLDPADLAGDFYFQNEGDGNVPGEQFRINYVSEGGVRHVVDGEPEGGTQPNQWYGVTARSDGSTLSLWIDDGFTGYQQVGSLDLTGTGDTNTALRASELPWTFGRGWYNGGFVDHSNGILDNIRFSDTALDVSEFIPLEVGSSLTLVVDPTTGETALRNDTNDALGFDYYRIDSDAGDLDPAGWNSLSDQGVDAVGPGDGESWDEAPGAVSANLLVEQFLTGETVLAPGESVALGAAYAGSGEGDLRVRYAPTGAALQRSKVIYQDALALPGDFNEDGTVDAADYPVWRESLGSTTELAADASGDGRITRADLNIWKANYGASLAPATAVPEPSAVVVALVGLAGLASRRR